jgi:hypothetical protein
VLPTSPIKTDEPIDSVYPGNFSDPLQRYPAPIGNRKAFYHLLRFSGYRFLLSSNIIRFYIFMEFHFVRAAVRITFSIRIIYKSTWYRRLQNYEDNATAICDFVESRDKNVTGKYECYCHTQGDVLSVSSNNVFYIDGVKLEYGEMNFSPGASKAAFNISNEIDEINEIVSLNDGIVYNNRTGVFWVRGKCPDLNVEKVPIRFYDVYTKEKEGVDVLCDVISREETDYQLKCTPPENTNVTGYIFQSNGTVKNTHINLNMSEYYDYVNVVHYLKNKTNADNINVHYRKNSSGLSAGAIAGIVIAICLALACIAILIIMLRRPKKKEENDSSIVGLRTIDNY